MKLSDVIYFVLIAIVIVMTLYLLVAWQHPAHETILKI
jgi:hypothetical protein